MGKTEIPVELKKMQPFWGEWIIDEPIGSGAYGDVYRVIRKKGRKADYRALKWIQIPLKTQGGETVAESLQTEQKKLYQEQKDRLLNEVKAMEQVRDSRNVVRIEDYLVQERPSTGGYDILIRMEYLTPLTKKYPIGPLDQETVVRLGLDICTALAVCESRNLIHRDLKPANIFIDDEGNFKLGDFGISRVLQDGQAGTTRIGTPAYMAPEMFSQAKNYDQTVDIYALSVMLYRYMNNGRLPFFNETEGIGTLEREERALQKRIRRETVPPATQASAELNRILLKAMSPYPGRRYQLAGEMWQDLASLPVDRKVERHQEQPLTKVDKPPKKHVWPVAAGIMAAAIAGVILIRVISDNTGIPSILPSVSDELFLEKQSSASIGTASRAQKSEGQRSGTQESGQASGTAAEREKRRTAAADILAEGNWGTCAWQIDQDGTLVVEEGTGESFDKSPWSDYLDQVQTVIFEDYVVFPQKCNYMFSEGGEGEFSKGNTMLKRITFGNIDTSRAMDLSYLFYGCINLTEIDLRHFDTSSVQNMSHMFCRCRNITQLDVSRFNTSAVTDMSGMFSYLFSLTEIDVSGFDTSHVEDMSRMFYGCTKLTRIDVSGFNTSSVKNMEEMFKSTDSLKTIDLSGFDISALSNLYGTFGTYIGLPDELTQIKIGGTILKNGVNIRETPNGRSVGRVNKGTRVKILETVKTDDQVFYLVSTGDLKGYVSEDLLEVY